MNTVQKLTGYLILLIGVVVGLFSGDVVILLITLFAGFVLVSLAELVRYVKGSYYRQLGITLKKEDIFMVIKHSLTYYCDSTDMELYSSDREIKYALVRLDGEQYIRARIFMKYLSQDHMEYTFKIPGRDPLVLNCSTAYYEGVNLFQFNDQVFVKVVLLGLKIYIVNDRLQVNVNLSA